jgi:steroid delta-isomerase-like uncharacterized protein
MRRFITLGTIALIVAAVVIQWQRVRELGRQVLSRGTEDTSMSEQENKAVARREIEEIFARGNLDAAEEIYAPDYVGHEPTSGDIRGIEGAKQFAATYRQAFPDLQPIVEDQVAEGDKVVTRFSARGTHQGETEEFGPPTGKRMEITGITIERFADGKIVEDWTNFDALGLMRQLGLMEQPSG